MDNTREKKFGEVYALLVALSERVFEKGKPSLRSFDIKKTQREPVKALKIMHDDVMQYTHKFTDVEWALWEILGEKIAAFEMSQFTDEKLSDKFLFHQSRQLHDINNKMSIKEATELWGYKTTSHVRQLCADGKIKAVKMGRDWWIDRDQPNPRKKGDG